MRVRPSEIYFKNCGSFEIVSGCCAHHFPTHFHRSDCLIGLTAGRAEIVVEAQKLRLGTGESVFIPRFTAHSLWPVSGAAYSYITLCFNNEISSEGQTAALVIRLKPRNLSPIVGVYLIWTLFAIIVMFLNFILSASLRDILA